MSQLIESLNACAAVLRSNPTAADIEQVAVRLNSICDEITASTGQEFTAAREAEIADNTAAETLYAPSLVEDAAVASIAEAEVSKENSEAAPEPAKPIRAPRRPNQNN
jgi:hypothetical protein